MMEPNLISIVIPVYNNEGSLENTHSEIKKVLTQNGYKHEIIFVDDGSVDGSFSVINSLTQKDNDVVAVKFVRNFGQHSATLAGIKTSKGDVIITVDADLQNDPLDIPRLIKKMQEGYQVVSGSRDFGSVPLFNRIRSAIVNWCIYYITGVKLKDSTSTFKAYRRDIIDSALKMEQYMKFLPVYICWIGSKITEIAVEYRPRQTGKSQYSLIKLIALLFDWVLLFSSGTKAVILLLFIGLGFILLGVVFFISFLISLLASTKQAESAILMYAFLSFFGGINFIVLGILTDRIKQLQITVDNQPLYIVETIISNKQE